VIVTIHQPSSQIWEVIDNGKDVYILCLFAVNYIYPLVTLFSYSCSTCRRTFDVSRGSKEYE